MRFFLPYLQSGMEGSFCLGMETLLSILSKTHAKLNKAHNHINLHTCNKAKTTIPVGWGWWSPNRNWLDEGRRVELTNLNKCATRRHLRLSYCFCVFSFFRKLVRRNCSGEIEWDYHIYDRKISNTYLWQGNEILFPFFNVLFIALGTNASC